MKKLNTLLILAMVALSVVSCKSDDDGDTTLEFNNANLAGVYNLTFYQATEVETVNVNGLDVVSTTTLDGETFQMQFTFAESGNVTVDGQYVLNYKLVVNGETQEEDTEIVDADDEVSTYSTTATPQLLTVGGDTYEVTLFNSNEVRLKLEETEVSNGVTTVYEEELRMTKN